MSIIKERIKEIIRRFKRNDTKALAEEIALLYHEKKQNGEKNPIDTTVEKIMGIIQENPDPEKIKEILTELYNAEKIPNRIFEKTATKISKTDEIPDKVITRVVKENTDISDEIIDHIIEEGEIDLKERLNLIQSVDNEEIIKKRVEKELNILYKNSRDKRDNEIVERIEILKEILKDSISEESERLIEQIIAKKMAENFYSDISKGTKIYTLSKILPVEKMIEEDLPRKVEEEYKKIEEKEGIKEGRFNKSNFKMQILSQMARDVAYRYDESGVFIIPQSNNMKKLEKTEEESFINDIQKFSGKQLSRKEITDIKAQIKGNLNNTQAKESLLISEIKKIPDGNKNEIMDILIKILENNETVQTLTMIEQNGLIKKLNLMEEEKREKTIKSIGEVLEKRKYKVTKSSPKAKGIQVKKIDNEEKDR